MPQGGNLPFGLAPSGSLTSYTPTLRERATDWMRRTLFTDDRAGQGQAEKVMDVASFTPFGFGLDMYDAGREAGQGNLGAAGATLAMSFAPGPSPKKIRAFHGSPHDFDRFDMSKIGTGEGAQAYGHGLYFAENEGVARNYRDSLTNRMPNHIESKLLSAGIDADTANTYARWAAATKGGRGSVDEFEAEMRQSSPSPQIMAFRKKVLDEIPKLRAAAEGIQGRMYEVNINADPDTFLDWDKPLSEQPQFLELLKKSKSPKIREIANDPKLLENMQSYGQDLGPMTGKELYNRISIMASGKTVGPEATPYLAKAGIPGIKYLDAGSRGAGDGTRNYVVFDDRLIEIVRKYGIAGASAILGYNLLDGMDPAQAEELKRIEGNQ